MDKTFFDGLGAKFPVESLETHRKNFGNRVKEFTYIKVQDVIRRWNEVTAGKGYFSWRVLTPIKEMFFGDDTHSVVDYILNDILIPAFKSTVSDMVNGGIEMLLFGERRSSSGASKIYRDRSRSYVPYNRISREDDRRSLSRSARTNHDFDQITIESRGEAEDVLSHLVDLIEDYEVASVADYYDLLGIESKFTDSKYGWTNVRDAYVERVRNGYSIHLPRPREI